MSTSRSVLSDSPALQGRKLQLESRSLRPNPAFISPEGWVSQRRSSTTTTPHSLNSPQIEAMPNPPKFEEVYPDMDDLSETNSIMSQTSQDILIPAPPKQDYGAFIEWLGCHFEPFITEEFEHFLLVDMKLLSIDDLADFLTTCVPKTLHESIGSRMYDANRNGIIDLKIIWHFIKQTYWNDQRSMGSYNAFLKLREKMCAKTTVLFPSSSVYTQPTPLYRPISSVVANLEYSMHAKQDSPNNRYEATSPRLVFPASDMSYYSEHGAPNRTSSTSSLYRDRYAMRTEQSYVPPYAKSNMHSEHTPMRSGSTTLPKDAGSVTGSHNSLRYAVGKSVESSSHGNEYSVQSVLDKSGRSNRSSPYSIKADASNHSTRSVRSSTRGVLHHKPSKPRAKLNETVYWAGYGESFLSFRRAIEGHLLQVGAGYLLDTHFNEGRSFLPK